MRFLQLIIILLLSSHAEGHEGHQAFYDISLENGELVMLAKMEIPDTEACLKSQEVCSSGQDFNFCAGLWLIDQMHISIDGKTRSFTFEESYTEDGHLFLKYVLGNEPKTDSEIEVSITAFLEQFPDYENIIQVALNENKQGYKLDKDRTTTTINLKP